MTLTKRLLALLFVFALVAAACGGDDDDTGDTAAETTEAAAETTTTAAAGDAETTTTAAEAMDDFEGLVLDAGGCDYGGRVEKISALDEHTVEFDLCGPHPAFLAQIAFIVFGIQPAEYLEATGGAPIDNPIGTGPYTLQEWVRGDSVVFQRFDDYYGQVAPHQTAVLRWATESAGRLLELQSGVASGMTFPGPEDYATIEADANLSLLDKPEPNIFYMGFTDIFAPFDDVRVRQAISLAMDRQRIIDTFYPPGSEVASHFTPCSVEFGCEGESWPDQDVAAAQALLAEAGFPDGFSTSIFYRDVTRGYLPTPGNVAADIQAQLKETLNIDAEVVQMESAEFIQQCSSAGQCDGIHLLGWTGDYPHVTNFLDFHFGEGVTQFGNGHPEIHEALTEASQTADPAVAQPLYETANNAIRDLVPMIPIAHAGSAFVAGSNVNGAYAPPWGQVLFNYWDNGTDTMVFVQGNEPISLYCADESDGESLRACAQVVEGLYSYSQSGEVQPQLATECVPNEDLSLWTCSLRNDVVFHDGSTLDANDVVVSFTAGLDAASPLHTGNSGAFDYYSYLWNGLINAEG
ncbi:MAG TPA: ABC transporter substrate-binding protein [Acidimicrobiia bacterium]|jgi:ABC-type transport system substrate-binding protein|nr:ABC transporter substrate-binding protein [Acidimicrobiia bacterium]